MINDTDLEAFGYWKEQWKSRPLDLNAYQAEAQKTAIYGVNHAVIYPALGLAGEAGEVANKVKKMLRDGDFDRNAVAAELGDCMWYIAALSRDLNISMAEIAMTNLEKLMKRKANGTIKGSGDNR
jgi:NTP pyrophosphatase (non-canonical NTP hydrolase)|tara:strand:- start:257 stop:631 length:375 start_codon:yes stop_codon:yes gene_type:complete